MKKYANIEKKFIILKKLYLVYNFILGYIVNYLENYYVIKSLYMNIHSLTNLAGPSLDFDSDAFMYMWITRLYVLN